MLAYILGACVVGLFLHTGAEPKPKSKIEFTEEELLILKELKLK